MSSFEKAGLVSFVTQHNCEEKYLSGQTERIGKKATIGKNKAESNSGPGRHGIVETESKWIRNTKRSLGRRVKNKLNAQKFVVITEK